MAGHAWQLRTKPCDTSMSTGPWSSTSSKCTHHGHLDFARCASACLHGAALHCGHQQLLPNSHTTTTLHSGKARALILACQVVHVSATHPPLLHAQPSSQPESTESVPQLQPRHEAHFSRGTDQDGDQAKTGCLTLVHFSVAAHVQQPRTCSERERQCRHPTPALSSCDRTAWPRCA